MHGVTFAGDAVELAVKRFRLGGVSADDIGLVGSPGSPMMTVSVGVVGVGSDAGGATFLVSTTCRTFAGVLAVFCVFCFFLAGSLGGGVGERGETGGLKSTGEDSCGLGGRECGSCFFFNSSLISSSVPAPMILALSRSLCLPH